MHDPHATHRSCRSGWRTGIAGLVVFLAAGSLNPIPTRAQTLGPADRGEPGDVMIQEYLAGRTGEIEPENLLGDLRAAEEWQQVRPRYLREFYEMLGLFPLLPKTPLEATVTGTLDRGDYRVDKLHYQSRPGLYVTANLYRPARIAEGERLPAILYVCGHSPRGRSGNKAAYQSHGIWFARNGYICLVLDTLQMGEIAGIHHGTYREERWWWISRGYTPAGVECWNGIRGIDYLATRPDVDPNRIGVTGISGGGATTFWIAAADDRARVAVPVSGLADLRSYIPNRVINGHCDCMFMYNTYQWPWARIAALIAPRPMLFVNSDRDPIFPMDANERVINQLEGVYSLFGASDRVDAFVSIGGHEYRQDIRQGAYRFLNTYLKQDPRPVLDSEVDLVTGSRPEQHPIAPEQLRVFPTDADVPADAVNDRIDELFVPRASVQAPSPATFPGWKEELLSQLRRLVFRPFPERIPAARAGAGTARLETLEPVWLETEPGIRLRLRAGRFPEAEPRRVVLWVGEMDGPSAPDWLRGFLEEDDAWYVCEPRGLGETRWTRRNPPNYVERSHYLLGQTVDSGRVWDIAAAARFLHDKHGGASPVHLAGEEAAAVLAVYAALLEPDIAGLFLSKPPLTHMDAAAPVLLNVLRVLDVPEALGLLAPRELVCFGEPGAWTERVAAIYQAAGAAAHLRLVSPHEQ